MKDLTVKLNGKIRLINKFTKDYVDIDIPRGTNIPEVAYHLGKIAKHFAGWSGISGNSKLDGDEIPEFHYYALLGTTEDGSGLYLYCPDVPFLTPDDVEEEWRKEWLEKNPSYGRVTMALNVDLNTNEIIMTDELSTLLKKYNIGDIYESLTLDI